SWVHHWNAIAIDASGLDHTPVETGEQRVFGENLGPGRSSRAMAITHIAIFDAVNAIVGGYRSYAGLAPAPDGTSLKPAIADAAPVGRRAADHFRAPAPRAMGSVAYAAAFDETKRPGGDGLVTPTEPTPEPTEPGIYWAYDGTPSLCAPPRLYNQITVRIADQMGSDVVELARLLALVNVAMADAGIAIWEAKYRYRFWRPVTGVREADEGSGPTG